MLSAKEARTLSEEGFKLQLENYRTLLEEQIRKNATQGKTETTYKFYVVDEEHDLASNCAEYLTEKLEELGYMVVMYIEQTPIELNINWKG